MPLKLTTIISLLLCCTYLSEAQTTLILQPDANAGKDAILDNIPPGFWDHSSNGISPQFPALAWTFLGDPGAMRCIVEFDLSAIPPNAIITHAELSLFAWDTTIGGIGQHSTHSGPNDCWLERVTSSWNESAVTWNTQPSTTQQNRVALPASSGPSQDYTDIDVTLLVRDMINNPSAGFGFMLKLANEKHYRKMNFCSSDHPEPALRPKLVITYEEPFTVYLGRDIILCEGDSMILGIKTGNDIKVKWNTGDTTRSIVVSKAGLYWVEITKNGKKAADTVMVGVGKKFIVYLGNDTSFCGAFSHLLDAGQGALKYRWNTGDTTVSILVDEQGMYAVNIKDANSCPSADTIIIKKLDPVISIRRDIDCKNVYLSVVREAGIKYLWSTGDTGISIVTDKKGKFSLTATGLFCSITKIAEVDVLPLTEIDLGADIFTCEENTPLLQCERGHSFAWSTGEITGSVSATKPGTYWVTVKEYSCTASDTINVGFYGDCGLTCYVPNAFSPNGDELNDFFKVSGDQILHIDMKIYNRWGQLTYSGSGTDAAWDGTYNGKPCEQDVYFYSIVLNGTQKRKFIRKEFNGTLSLLR